jgi:hypothetical protein
MSDFRQSTPKALQADRTGTLRKAFKADLDRLRHSDISLNRTVMKYPG